MVAVSLVVPASFVIDELVKVIVVAVIVDILIISVIVNSVMVVSVLVVSVMVVSVLAVSVLVVSVLVVASDAVAAFTLNPTQAVIPLPPGLHRVRDLQMVQDLVLVGQLQDAVHGLGGVALMVRMWKSYLAAWRSCRKVRVVSTHPCSRVTTQSWPGFVGLGLDEKRLAKMGRLLG